MGYEQPLDACSVPTDFVSSPRRKDTRGNGNTSHRTEHYYLQGCLKAWSQSAHCLRRAAAQVFPAIPQGGPDSEGSIASHKESSKRSTYCFFQRVGSMVVERNRSQAVQGRPICLRLVHVRRQTHTPHERFTSLSSDPPL
jgi:hypothetical protein